MQPALKKSSHDTKMIKTGEKKKKNLHQKISRLWSRDGGYGVCWMLYFWYCLYTEVAKML